MCSLNTAVKNVAIRSWATFWSLKDNQFMLYTLTSLSLVDRITHKGTEVLWKGMTATAEMVVMEPIMGVVFWYRPLVCIWVDTVHFCRWVSWWLWRRMGGWCGWHGLVWRRRSIAVYEDMIQSLSMRCSMTFLARRTRRLRRETNIYMLEINVCLCTVSARQ